jgi:23S rRNA pseudouridine2605 synthase
MKQRVQKILARSGYGSRRGCEDLITQNRVRVNGKLVELGMKADREQDTITVDGQPIPRPEPHRYIALHKPPGVLSTVKTSDSRPTVRDYIQLPGRLYPVGRLDVDSEGLILMTNDGKLTNRLTHPRFEHEKEYRVLVSEKPGQDQLQRWKQGITLRDGHRTLPAQVWIESSQGSDTWLGVILKEGQKRQIRRMGDLTDMTVKRLVRIRIATLNLGNLPPGKWRELTAQEVKKLKQQT